MSRLVGTAPERLNLRTLDALCQVLNCGPGDMQRRETGPWASQADGSR